MTFIAVVAHNPQNRITKYALFETQVDADAHVALYRGFAAEIPGGGSMPNLLVDSAAETVSIDNVPGPPPPPLPENTPLTAEDSERLFRSQGITPAQIIAAKRDRGKPLP